MNPSPTHFAVTPWVLTSNTKVKEEVIPETLVKARERARVSGSERHTVIEKQKNKIEKQLLRWEKKKNFSPGTTTAQLVSCQ